MVSVTQPAYVCCMQGGDDPEELAGGLACVQYLAEAHAGPDAEAASVAAGADCVSVLISGTAGRYRAESYDPDGHAIQFCGHGALAAALHVFNELEPDAIELEFFNRRHQWAARRGASADTDISLIYKRPELTRCSVPEFARDLLGVSSVRAAKVGGANDYLVLELASPNEVLDLEPNFDAFAAATGRAVIATACGQDDRDQGGIVFRYFAPQYGQPEDDATGSAAVQLGAYWAADFGAERIAVRQLSAGGARMYITCQEGSVELSARVAYRY